MRWLRSRWVLVPGGLLVTVALWNLYVAANAGGVVEGQVIDSSGAPVQGANVLLYERSFITNNERQRTITGPDGRFRFDGNGSHAVQLQAEGAGGRSERLTVRLWFRAQNRRLEHPLRLPGTAS
ncbi:carboxypeptidase-like regulatory domain-containing protein [Roseomonas sp. CAU 1739]|uniref:carboxypeptidase-like regulatory domain-containing protein n=1 Tax=Roseomonas sp. CAU 1739 TaxID=3140364 RepID=UPI00325A76A4